MATQKMMQQKKAAAELKTYFTIFLAVVVVAYVFFILSDSLSDTLTVNSTAWNATANIESSMLNATAQLPQAGTLIGIGVILGVIGMAVYGARRYGLF